MPKFLLSGYYGFNNLGDEAILYSLITGLQEVYPRGEIAVLSNLPQETTASFSVTSFHRYYPWEIHQALKWSDCFISGGGSLLQDVTSWYSPLYYLGLIRLANLYSLPSVFCCQGVGPLKREWLQKLTADTLATMDKITVRDFASRDLLLELGLKAERISVLDDPVFLLSPELLQELRETISWPDLFSQPEKGEELLATSSESKILGLALRPWKNNSYLKPLALGLSRFCQANPEFKLLFLPFHGQRDYQVSQQLISRLTGVKKEKIILARPTEDPRKLLSLYDKLDLLLGVRLHSLVFAALTSVPLVAIEYDPKIAGFLARFAEEPAGTTGNITADRISSKLAATWKRKEDWQKNLTDYKNQARKRLLEFLQNIIPC